CLLSRFLEAVAVAFDGDDLAVMQETVDQADDAGGIREDLRPFGKGLVGGEDGRSFLISAADDLNQKVGMAVGIGKIPIAALPVSVPRASRTIGGCLTPPNCIVWPLYCLTVHPVPARLAACH
uniref:hypothetical protein n=1 Tax=Rhizobium sp. PDO1-076 TaxID=1125979 RepID=UPI001FCBCDA7